MRFHCLSYVDLLLWCLSSTEIRCICRISRSRSLQPLTTSFCEVLNWSFGVFATVICLQYFFNPAFCSCYPPSLTFVRNICVFKQGSLANIMLSFYLFRSCNVLVNSFLCPLYLCFYCFYSFEQWPIILIFPRSLSASVLEIVRYLITLTWKDHNIQFYTIFKPQTHSLLKKLNEKST